MKHSILCIVASLAFLGAAQRAMATPIFVNGSFEADPWSGFVSNPTVTGWTVTGPGDGYPFGVHNGSGGPTPFGSQFILPGGFGTGGGTAAQTVSGFTSGNAYEVTFDLSSESTGSGALARLSIPAGSSAAPQTYTAPAATHLQGWDVWRGFTYDFTATAPSVTFLWTDLGAGSPGDFGLDNVSVAPLGTSTVPEPATLALLGTGLLAVARRRFAARRR